MTHITDFVSKEHIAKLRLAPLWAGSILAMKADHDILTYEDLRAAAHGYDRCDDLTRQESELFTTIQSVLKQHELDWTFD
jgi:hypothetical protein